MSVVVVTGSCGLIGSESVSHFAKQGFDVVGLDNGMRSVFFGPEASTDWARANLLRDHARYRHHCVDIRDTEAVRQVFRTYGRDIVLVIHTAAQPSHDWAAQDPFTDFSVNASATLTLLECTRDLAPGAVFIFTSTNKVYGDTPNRLPLVELGSRWEVDPSHPAHAGIDESMSIDATTHSLFGASKAAADLLVQEYGRYFGMKTVCFRGGCLTGPNHSGAPLHGFLAYLVKCAVTGTRYTVHGYKGKQVRDNIHSADLLAAFDAYFRNPRAGEVYNIGGGRACNCSVLEAIDLVERISGRTFSYELSDRPRRGDHIWYISSLAKFQAHYPSWRITYDLEALVQEVYKGNVARSSDAASVR